MRICHVHQRFHAVGHGTFVTGIAIDNACNEFSWVYDCGSKRSQPLNRALQEMDNWNRWPATISMVVLSHFDDDHVNGIEALIKKRRVGCLVLPYTDWPLRLRETAMGGIKGGISPSSAQMQLDPVGWLESRDLTQQIGRLVLIRGGHSEPDTVPPDLPLFQTDPRHEINKGPSTDEERNVGLEADWRLLGQTTTTTATLKIQVHSHHQPFHNASLPMEFMFYNAALSGSNLGIIGTVNGILVAKKSRWPLPQAKSDVEKTIRSLGLVYPFSSLPKNWRTTLKACYQKHFGSTGKARNNISLCLSVIPRNDMEIINLCSMFSDSNTQDISTVKDKEVIELDFSRPAVLYTGDLKMDKQVILEMCSHFGKSRWCKIGLTQVPHHGSTHSWATGNAALLNPSAFVHCAPGTRVHPHPSVIMDLLNQRVFTADYTNSVTLNYHFPY